MLLKDYDVDVRDGCIYLFTGNDYYHASSLPKWQHNGSQTFDPAGGGGGTVPLPPPPGGVGWSPQYGLSPPPAGATHHFHISDTAGSGPYNNNNNNDDSSGPHGPGPALPPPSPSVALGFVKSTFSYEELAAATEGFSAGNLLGQGGFGYVHKGVLPNGKEVAVKQLKSGSGQGDREFQAEVEIISRVHHRHLVSLVGYCISQAQRMLVYEFVPNNTLEHHLYGTVKKNMLINH